jgi:hypothetical protein
VLENIKLTLTGCQTPSISLVWSPADPIISKQSKPQKPLGVCKHLSGPAYDEYILRMQTCTLGGISPDLRAAAVRNLFPYKKLPPLKEFSKKKTNWVLIQPSKQAEVSPSAEALQVPADGSAGQQERTWTDMEKRKLDGFLTGWARWIGNYNMGYICATRCEGTTENHDGTCDQCRLVASDESLKKAVQRVSFNVASSATGQWIDKCVRLENKRSAIVSR